MKDKSFGIIPIFKLEGENLVLLVQHSHGNHWSLPKGHPEEGESEVETASRELFEETGLREPEILSEKVFEEYYEFTTKSGEPIEKSVSYFIGLVSDPVVLIQEAEILDFKWLSFDDAIDEASFEGTKRILTDARSYLAEVVK
jgi:8-oxo-dGTP pyrophosphatase MutT (NUDIX family)